MSDPSYLKNLKKLGSEEPTKNDIKRLEAEYFSGPDRAAAVLLAAMVERSLTHLLRQAMRQQGTGNILDSGGIIGAFRAKIDVAYAFQHIGPITRHDLTIIRVMRNQFAHSRKPIRFTTDVVETACQNLAYPDQPGVFLNFRMLEKTSQRRLKDACNKNHPRTRFFTACNEIAQRIYFIRAGDKDHPLNQLI